MADKQVWTAATILAGNHDMTDEANEVRFGLELAVPETSTFGDGAARSYGAGMTKVDVSISGFLPAADVSPEPHTTLGLNNIPVLLTQAATPSDGDVAVMINSIRGTGRRGAQLGEACAFDINGSGPGGWGHLLGKRSAISAAGNGSEVNAGAIAAGGKAFAFLWVLSGTTGNLDLKIQSDTTGFASPTDRATFATVASGSAPTFQVLPITDEVTDTYWRDDYTPSAGVWSFASGIFIL